MARKNHKDLTNEIPAQPQDDAAASGSEAAKEGIGAEERQRSKISGFFLSLLSGNILSNSEVRRAYPYMLLLAALAFIYITVVFRTQSLHREYSALSEEVRELRSRSMTIASQKMIATRQSAILEEIERRNIPLRESLKPNKVFPAK